MKITEVQVNCRELSKEQIQKMVRIIKLNGYSIDKAYNALSVHPNIFEYFRICNGSTEFFAVISKSQNHKTITYDEFVELFEKKKGNTSDFKRILDSIGSMLDYKDKNYGNAALQPLDIFARHHGYGSRLDEKLARVKNCEELRKNDVADIIGGLVLICRDKGWNNFDDLKD